VGSPVDRSHCFWVYYHAFHLGLAYSSSSSGSDIDDVKTIIGLSSPPALPDPFRTVLLTMDDDHCDGLMNATMVNKSFKKLFRKNNGCGGVVVKVERTSDGTLFEGHWGKVRDHHCYTNPRHE